MRPPLIKTNLSDHKEDRLTEFVKELSRFDIVCLQEVFTTFNTRKQRLISYGAKSGLSWSVVSQEPSLFSGFLTDGGLLIMSRFPIIDSEFHPYPYGVLCDAISYKGVLYAKIMIGDKILHLFNTHTQATYFGVHVDDFVRFILWIHDSPPSGSYL
jgi:endonuclease/exonuclease/phosphatase family metal-dependent hydrolase